jgi:hypothetical protein
MVVLALLAFAGLFVALPTGMWLRTLPDAERRWLPRQVGTEHVGAGSYRDTEVPRFSEAGAPRIVHVTAMMSWVLGTMFVPGLLAGLVGLLAAGVGVVSIPGLMLAWRLFGLGAPLLRGDPDAADKARTSAKLARYLNAVVLTLSGITALTQLPSFLRSSTRSDAGGVLLFALAVAVYGCISLLHASMLDRVAGLIDAQNEAHADATGVRVMTDEETARAAWADAFESASAEVSAARVDAAERREEG